MPKAIVATITMSSDETNAAWLRARTCGSSPHGKRAPSARPLELPGELLRRRPAGGVDDARPRLLRKQRLQLLRDAVARSDMVADVRPVEAGEDQPVFGDAELDEDIGARLPVRGRGEGEAGHARETLQQRPQQPVIRPEIVAPFRDAMRFVDRDQRERHVLQQLAEAVARCPFRRRIEEVELAGAEAADGLLAIVVG
jgi:hypothetical protein